MPRNDREYDREYKRRWRRAKAAREGRIVRPYHKRAIVNNANLAPPPDIEERIARLAERAAQGLPLFG